jgi:hypothetical protein
MLSATMVQSFELPKTKLTGGRLCSISHIFVYDYKQMRENCLLFKEELMKERFHLDNLSKFGSWGIDGFYDSETDDE